MKTYYIESLGCPKNLVDSETFAYIINRSGNRLTTDAEEADHILINTCAFITAALAELDSVLSYYATLKQAGEITGMVVTGCVMNRDAEEFIQCYPEVDTWIPLKDFAAFERYLEQPVSNCRHRFPLEHVSHTYLRISDGCDNRCSYCTIPSIRGGMRSVPIPDLYTEALMLAEHGAKELTLVAQDTCNYGLDIYGRKALPELIARFHDIPQYRWIRVMYMHPDHFEREWIGLYQQYPKLLPYFEFPVQHCCGHILRKMGRSNDGEAITALIADIREALPGAVFRTTLMTGFPGESADDFKALCQFVDKTGFLFAGVFAYSRESGTRAIDLPDQVKESVAVSRKNKLLNRQAKITEKILEQCVGKVLEVLVECSDTDELGYCLGRAWFNAPEIDGITLIEGEGLGDCKVAEVEITDAIGNDLFGRYLRTIE